MEFGLSTILGVGSVDEGVVFGITGGRRFPDEKFVWDTLTDFMISSGPLKAMVNGMAPRGVDLFAYNWAKSVELEVRQFPADWDALGEFAGPIRNQQMIDDNKDMEVLLIFPGNSGTLDMMRRARKAKLQRVFYAHDFLDPKDLTKWG
jgi:hypothetical protein